MNDAETFNQAHADVCEFVTKMRYQYDPLTIAALLVVVGFGLYKSMFDEADYKEICDTIHKDLPKIKAL